MFHKSYVINLARSRDNKSHMEAEFAKLQARNINLNHSFFDAIDGKDVESLKKYDFKIPNWHDPSSGKAMTYGEVGCALSHYLIWKEIVDLANEELLDNNTNFLILEDDVVFLENFYYNFISFTSNITINYDLLYLNRKALYPNNEIQITPNIVKVDKSYWTCAYVLTVACAKKLISANYLDNLIPVDEFLPIMYGCQVLGFEKLFENREKISAYATTPPLLTLTNDAFTKSETFHSDVCTLNNTNSNKDVCIIYDGIKKGHSYDRFISHARLYNLSILSLDSGLNDLLKILNSWDFEKAKNTLLVLILRKKSNVTSTKVIPMAPPREFLDKYDKLATDKIISIHGHTTDHIFFCSYASSILAAFSKSKYIDLLDALEGESIADVSRNFFHKIEHLNEVFYDDKKNRSQYFPKKTYPCIVYEENQPSNIINRIGNYSGNGWNQYYKYRYEKHQHSYPKIYLSIFYKANSKILEIIDNLNYPKDKIEVHINSLKDFNCNKYPNANKRTYDDEDSLYREDVVSFLNSDCDYYFYIDGTCLLTNSNVLDELLSLNKDVIAPFVKKEGLTWSNFWGDLDTNGFYKLSFDYHDIVKSVKCGCWNVPYITSSFLVKRSVLESVPDVYLNYPEEDPDMRFCHNLRDKDIYMYLTNISYYGKLVDETDDMAESDLTIYDLVHETKRASWEKTYLHPDLYQALGDLSKLKVKELHADIYQLPLFSKAFCKELITRMEAYGKWSKGLDEHTDHRLGKNYYENFPTQDIQLFQINLDKVWDLIINKYIAPLVKIIYSNYKTKKVHMAFVVKYDANHQSSLDPHHDASTYTMNVALNEGGGVEYEGGGCHLIRQNLSIINQEVGTVVLHPGRLTAYHQGLKTTKGIRYILVSFVD